MEENNQLQIEAIQKLNVLVHRNKVLGWIKQVKKNLGSKCTFLSLYTRQDTRHVKCNYIGKDNKKSTVFYDIPYDLNDITQADINRLQELISLKMN